jgi:hypothetical protein
MANGLIEALMVLIHHDNMFLFMLLNLMQPIAVDQKKFPIEPKFELKV